MKTTVPGDPNYINPSTPELPKLYANGFATGYSASDMYIIGQVNGNPSFLLNMSFSSAKSLKVMLDDLITRFEKTAEFEIHSSEEIANTINKNTQQ